MKFCFYRLAEYVVARVPRAVAYGLAIVLVELSVLIRPSMLDALHANLDRALGSPGRRIVARTVRANAHNLGRSWVDVLRMSGEPGSHGRRVTIHGEAHMEAALRRGAGVVFASSHLGPWDAGLAGYNAAASVGPQLAVLAEVLRPPRLFAHLRAIRERHQISVIPIDVTAMRESDEAVARQLGAAALRRVFRLLRSNGGVAIAIDRDLTGAGESIPFFGAPAPIPLGVVEIAIRSGAALIPGACVRDGRGLSCWAYPAIDYDPKAPREAEVRRVARALLGALEPVIREHADQWHVMSPIWPATAPTPARLRFPAMATVGLALIGAIGAVALGGTGLGIVSTVRHSHPILWVEPAAALALGVGTLRALRQASVWAQAPKRAALNVLRRVATNLSYVGLATGLSGMLVVAVRA